MRLAQCFLGQPRISLLRECVGHFLADFAQAETGAGVGVVDPKPATIFPGAAGQDPDGRLYAKSGNGGSGTG